MQDGPGITALEIAQRLGGRLEGDRSHVVLAIETIEKAGPEMLTWVGSPEYAPKATASAAGVVLMPLEGEAPAGKTVIRVADPDLALCEVVCTSKTPVTRIVRDGLRALRKEMEE